MSMPASPSGQGTAGGTDTITALQGIIRQLAAWVKAFQGRITQGAFTMAASATTTVAQTAVQSKSNITLTPANAAAATLVGSAKSPYISSVSPGTSFTVATANGGNAVGTEIFDYQITTAS
jgi:hypothetical protein